MSKVTQKRKSRIARQPKKHQRRAVQARDMRELGRQMHLAEEARKLDEQLDKLTVDAELPGGFPVDAALGAVFSMFAQTVKGDDAVIAQALATRRLARYSASLASAVAPAPQRRRRGKS